MRCTTSWYVPSVPVTPFRYSASRRPGTRPRLIARAVRDPRGVLAEFGVDIAADVEVRVWDSTAELRYLVIPQRPAGTDDMSEAELAGLVTRNSMIGTDRELGRE